MSDLLTITDKAREYLLAKGGVIHIIDNRNTPLCCGRINFGPTVSIGAPGDIRNYTETAVNGIRVYMPLRFRSPFPLSVEVQTFFGWTTLHLEGWKIL